MSCNITLMKYFGQLDRGWVLSLLLAVCLVYLPFLGNPFIFDDLPFFQRGNINKFLTGEFHYVLRWLPYSSLSWIYALFSDVFPHFYHLNNLLLHGVTVLVLFYLLRQIIVAVFPECTNSTRMIWGAWFAALIFALHPVAVYAVGYVIQYSILMATLFVLLMQLAYLRGLQSGQKRWLVLAVLAYYFAVSSKEHSLLAPALLGAQTILLRGQIKTGTVALWLTWGALGAIGMHIILLAKGVLGIPYEIMATNLFTQQRVVESTSVLHALSVLTQAGLFFKYLCLWLLPNPAWMSIDMREPFITSLSLWQGWLGAAGFVLYGGLNLGLLLRQRWAGLVGFAMLYPWLLFLLEFSSIRVQEPFVLYRSYLWLPGMLLLIPILLLKLPGRKPLMMMAIVAILLLPLAWNRLWIFGDQYRLWNDAVILLKSEITPGADRIFYNRGTAASANKPQGEAIADLERSIALSPQLAPLHLALGYEYYREKQYHDAMAQFDSALVLEPENGSAYYAKGLIYKRLNDKKHLIEQMKKACEFKDVAACLITEMSKKNK